MEKQLRIFLEDTIYEEGYPVEWHRRECEPSTYLQDRQELEEAYQDDELEYELITKFEVWASEGNKTSKFLTSFQTYDEALEQLKPN